MKELECTFKVMIPSLQEVLNYLDQHNYNHQIVDIRSCFNGDSNSPNKNKISQLPVLEDKDNFVYIKLVKIEHEYYGLVAGVTNTNNPDVKFASLYDRTDITRADLSKKILTDYRLDWERDKIIIISSKELNRKQLEGIEKELQSNLGLLGS